MDQRAEWLGLVERQQQEIEWLRRELAAARGDGELRSPLRSRRGSDASVASSVASLAFSVLSADAELPMDSERYARICEKMERMRAALATKDAKLRKARAQCGEGQKLATRLRDALTTARSEMEAQRAQFVREHAASQEAVDKAVETAAQALVKNDLLTAELGKLREEGAALREDFRVRCSAVKEADAARLEMQKQLLCVRQEAYQLTDELRALQNDRNVLQATLQGVQQELTAKRQSDSEWNGLRMQKEMLQQRVNELETSAQRQILQFEQQAMHIGQQHQQIEHLKETQASAERTFATEHAEDQRHAAHLLKSNIQLQQELEAEQARSLKLNDQVRQMFESSQLLAEDLLQSKLKVAARDQMLLQRGEKYCALASAYRSLGRHAQALESSERDLVSVLIPTKKRLALLQDTLTRFCYELEGVSKQMIASRNRLVLFVTT
ncbi:unnamed protein product [Phytophthora lilii]|uniref:Unnamed protein product n=1 Tax=Phytophthora lilii TaxID=2077276 RepID=A0A9W6X0G3_9STRA|nr:unnamed protein product [Phytophthora lilii]